MTATVPEVATSDDATTGGGRRSRVPRPARQVPAHEGTPPWVRSLRRLLGPIALLAIWWLVTEAGWVAPTTLPRPADVWSAGVRMVDNGRLQGALWASSRRVLSGLALGIVAGLLVAVVAGLTRFGEDLLDSTMQVVKAVPNVALTPLLIIWLGIDEPTKITLIALSTSMPIYMNTYGAIRGVDARLVDAGRTLGLGRWGLVRHIILPGSVPGFLVGLRMSVASAWIALVFAESVNAQEGLGKLMSEGRTYFQLDVMVLVLVIYAVVGLFSYGVVRWLEARLLVWRRGFEGA